jgi:hypothetical protein
MTKQDKWNIKIGGGFTGKHSPRKFDYPPERITEFLKLDTNSEKEVSDYCSKYQLILLDTKNLFHLIKREQKKLNLVANKFFNHELIEKSELDHVNKRLGNIKICLNYPSLELQNSPSAIKNKFKKHEFDIAKRYPDPFSSLWEDLITHFVRKQDVRQCINCGDYFVKTSKQHQLYCSNSCKGKLKQARNRGRKKLIHHPL